MPFGDAPWSAIQAVPDGGGKTRASLPVLSFGKDGLRSWAPSHVLGGRRRIDPILVPSRLSPDPESA